MTDQNVVPFGKYKGQPVEAMAQDRDYCDWLIGQDWFRTRFTAIHTLIVNNFAGDAETPDHNALQGMFVNYGFRAAFAVAYHGGWSAMHATVAKRVTAAEQRLAENNYEKDPWEWARKRDLADCEAAKEAAHTITIFPGRVAFEVAGADVEMECNFKPPFFSCSRPHKEFGGSRDGWRIECKPSVGDDYPAILRQMKASECNVLFVGKGGYRGSGVDLATMTEIFRSARITIVWLEDVERALAKTQ